jgi:phytoene dehydrogenase-like protein
MQQGYDYDAVVIGAGPNGLAAAIRIAQHGFSTLLLGGSSKVGEASYTGFCIDATPNPLPRRDTFALAAMASTGVFFKTLLSKAFQ